MKQGDPLSCVIFIICIDPLIRNINSDRLILALELKTKITKRKLSINLELLLMMLELCAEGMQIVYKVFLHNMEG